MELRKGRRVRKRVFVYCHLRPDYSKKNKMGLTTVIKDYGTEILNAIRENDLQRLKSICEKHLKADKKIQKLCVADIKHKPTKKFACPLILAARQEDPRIMKYMMDKGVDPNFVHHTIFSSKRKEIVTALHISVDLGLYDTVQILLDANADANIGDHNQETPLHISVKKADKVMTRMLLSKGADPKIPDRRGNAALHVATLYGHLQLVRTLLKYDADVYQKGQWDAVPPHIAAKEGHIHLIQLFCSRDVGNINIKIPCYLDKREKAPIHLAAENGHVETVLALVDQFDAEVNLKDSDGNTPLHCVVLNQYNPHRMRDKEYFNETAKVLIKFGVAFNEKNVYGDTALHLAAMNQFQRIVELLLQIGGSPFIENDEKLKPIDVVPDFDPVTKQVLKNAMLNPRPVISGSRSTLLSRDLSSMMSGHNIFRKPHSIGSVSPDPIESMHRSHSKASIDSSLTIESSVFEDPVKSHKYRDPYYNHGHSTKGRRPPSSNESDRYDDDDRNSGVLYSKVNKPKKQSSSSGQQTDRKQTHNYGTQYENEDDSVSMISVQDHMTQVSMKTDSTVVNNELRNIVNKDRKKRRNFDDDDRIESVSDITSIQGSESTYMSMEGKKRPKPRPRPSKSTENIYRADHNEGIIYENLKGDSGPPLPSRSRNQSTTSLNQRSERLPSTGQGQGQVQGQGQGQGAAGIRLIPGKNGTIEVQYGGNGGTPLTIQFDTSQFGVTPSADSQGNLVLNSDKSGYQDTDQYSSFSIDTVQTAQSEAYQPGFTPGNYGYRAGDLSMDSTEMESSHVSEVQRDAVRNAIQQTVYDMTSDGRMINKGAQQRQQGQPIYQNEEVEDDDDVTSAGQFNKKQLEAQQALTQQQLQQAMEQLQHFELNQGQLEGIHKQLQQLMIQQQELQKQHLRFQEEQQKAMAEAKTTKKKKSKSSKQAAQRPTKEPPPLPVQPPPPPPPPAPVAPVSPPSPPSPPVSADETFVIEEDEVVPSPESPNAPTYMNFNQALAFAKAVEAKSAENSPVAQRKMRPEPVHEDRAGPMGPTPRPRQQGRNGASVKQTQYIVTTPEKNKWDVKPGTATTVEMANDDHGPHSAHTGQMGQMRNTTVQSHYITTQTKYVSSADVASRGVRHEEVQSESEESEYQTEEEEERPPMEIMAQVANHQKSHNMYYSITPEETYQESGGRHTPDELNSYHPQRAQQTRQPAAAEYNKVSDAVPSASATAESQLEKGQAPESDADDNEETGDKIESGNDEGSKLDDESGPERRALSLDDVRVVSVTTSSPERNVTSPSPLEMLRRNARTPESFVSETSSARSGLNMRVTGEAPKAYNRATKGVARRAFMLHKPIGIESCSETSDTENYDSPSRSRLSSRSLYSPSSALSPARSPTIFEFKEPTPDPPRPVKLLGASIPKPYKSFGKIETKTDALEEALAEAEAMEREEMRRAEERLATRHEVQEAKQALIQKHIGAREELQKEGISPDFPTSPINVSTQEVEYTIAHIEHQRHQQGEQETSEQQEQIEVKESEKSGILASEEEELTTATEDESEEEEEEEEEKSSDSSSDSSDQGEFNFETGEISADVEEMDELEDFGIEPIESMFGSKRTVKPRPKVDPAQVEAARKLAESRKSPAGKKGKLSTAAHGGVGQPISVSVSKAMMRRRMSPSLRKTPIQADTIEEADEPIEEEDEEESEAETEASSEVSEQPTNLQHDKSFSPLSVHSKDDLDEEHLAIIESGSTTDTVMVRTVHTKETVTVVEQRVGQDGDVETVSTTVVKSGGQKKDGQYLEPGEGELDTSSEIEKYDENFDPVGSKHEFHPSPLSDQSREEQNDDTAMQFVNQKDDTVKTVVSQVMVREHRGRSFGSDSVSSTVSEPNSVASVIEVKTPSNVPEITTTNVLDSEDDEVAQISLAAEERKVKKKKKKSTSSAPGDGLEVDTKVVKKKKTKKKVADQSGDSQTGATGLTVEEGEAVLAEKPKKKKKKEKDGTEVKKKKKKKTSESTSVAMEVTENQNGSSNVPIANDEQEKQSEMLNYDQEPFSRPGAHSNRKVTVPLSINTQQGNQQEYPLTSALDPLSPAKSDTSEKSLGTPEGIEATLFGTKLERQETVKENKEGPRRAGFWSGRKVATEEPLSPVSPSDINRQYKSAMEMPSPKYDMDDEFAQNQEYPNDDAQMRMRQVAHSGQNQEYPNEDAQMRMRQVGPSGQRQPPVGQEDHPNPSLTSSTSVHETNIDDVLAFDTRNTMPQRPDLQNQTVSSVHSSGTVHETNIDDVMPVTKSKPKQKPAIPKKPKDLLKQSSNTPSPISGSPVNPVAPYQGRKVSETMQGNSNMYQDLPIKDIPIKDLGESTQTVSTTVTSSQSKWGHSRDLGHTNSSGDAEKPLSVDETQAVSQLWKENEQHEAEMQRILASMTESDTSETAKYATIGGAQDSALDDKKQHMKMTLEGHTVYDNDVEMELQQSTKGSWGKHVPGKTIGAPSVVRPQPVYASAARRPSLEADQPKEEVQKHVPVPAAVAAKRAAEELQEAEETTTNFQRQVSMRLKKKKKKQQPEGVSGAISDSEALRQPAGYDSDVAIHSEAEANDFEVKGVQPSLQDAAMAALADSLKNQPKLKPRRPMWDSDVPINYTRGVYRPYNPPVLYGSSQYHGSYDDSALVAKMFGERNKPNPFTESEGEADTEGEETHHVSFRPQPQMNYRAPIAPHAFSAFQPVSPSTKKVTIVERQSKKKKKKKDQPINTEPGPIDLDQYSATARLWLEQVDKKTVEKSKTMKMAIMSENQRPPAELLRNLPEDETGTDDVFLPPQWILIRGRTLRGRKNKTSASSANRSFASESDFDMHPDRPLSPGRQNILFFRLGSNWKDLAWVLFEGMLSDADTLRMIKDIQLKNPGDIRGQVNDMMKRWWKKRGSSATLDELQKALEIVHTAYVQEEFFNQRSTLTSYTDTEDDLEIGEVSDNDPDVSRIIGEYESRSPNSSFECDPPPISGKPITRDSVRSMSERSIQRGRHDFSRDSMGRYSTASSGYFADQSFRHDTSRDSFLDESSDKFTIITPQLKHQEYRHETTI